MPDLRHPAVGSPGISFGHLVPPLPHEALQGQQSAQDEQQNAVGCITIDMKTVGVRNRNRVFALQVKGDSMVGKNITNGDYVIVEQGKTPQTGDVVAALIDNESTLKTYMTKVGKPVLKAENPKYPDLIPAAELSIQGVMVALVRKAR